MRTNYVYDKHKSGYRTDLADKLPETPSLPTCFDACAKFVALSSIEADVTKATGPSSATTAGQQEIESSEKDAAELDKWLSLLEENHAEVAEMTSLPAFAGAHGEHGGPHCRQ